MKIPIADRLSQLPPYLFAAIDKLKADATDRGMDVISLGVGDPVEPTPEHIIEALESAAHDKANHQYPSYTGMSDFRKVVANWYEGKAGLTLDPDKEVMTLIGAKEGVAHMPFAFINPGDVVLVPDPAYPVYFNGTLMAGGNPVLMPLLEENDFLPDLSAIDPETADRAKLMWLNYPGNPTAATATVGFFEEVVAFAKKHNIAVCHDGAYSEVTFDDYRAPSFLEATGAMDVSIEFHSLSKTYNMTGWRIGWVAGNAHLIEGLGKVKTNIDSGAFQAVQHAGIAALEGDQSCVANQNAIYRQRRDILLDGLGAMGLDCRKPIAACYVWCRVPEGFSSSDFTAKLIEEIGVVTTPGSGFGKHGEGFIRMTLTVETDRLIEAVERMKTLSF